MWWFVTYFFPFLQAQIQKFSMFHFKHFSLYHDNSALKISTDAVLLAAAATPVDKVRTVLDIGCGCGVIAYCLAWKMQQEVLQKKAKKENVTKEDILHKNVLQEKILQDIIGIDIDTPSIGDALKSKEIFPQRDFQHIHFHQQSIQEFSKNYSEKFDLIVSNPPFFVDALKPNTPQKNISKHNDTLPFEDLRDAVCQLLKPDSRFFLILPVQESERFEQCTQNQLFKFYQLLIQPTPSKPVNRIITGYRLLPTNTVQTEQLCMRNADNTLSQPYQRLTEDFLLG